MADAKYAFQGMTESMARAMKRDAELSMKVALEMSAFLKGRTTTEAKTILERVLKKTQAVPFRRFNDGVGHRKGAGITAGRYPQKGSEIFTDLIKSVEANAQAKGLSSDLKIIHLAPQKASGAFHYGRLRSRKFKRVHLEIAVKEMEKESKEKKTKSTKPAKKETVKEVSKETEHKKEHVEHVAHSEHKTHDEQSQTEKPKKKAPAKKVQEDKQ